VAVGGLNEVLVIESADGPGASVVNNHGTEYWPKMVGVTDLS
jgi:hypothetical protein